MGLAILKVETTCNTSDKVLLQNLQATKARGFAPVPFVFEPQNKPLLLCGSGPSLLEYFAAARKFFPHADIMAMNGAYNALLSIGEVPKYYVQLDARPENTNFVADARPETTFLLASQCAPAMFKALSGHNVQVYHLNTPTTRRVFPEEKVYFGGGATVGSTAMAVAAGLGYRDLKLFGYDSSYRADKSHILPQPQNAGQKTLPVFVDDREYLSTPTMAKQVEEFRPWLKGLEAAFPGLEVYLFGDGLLYDYIQTGQSRGATRESEAAKYAELYTDPSYGMSRFRAEVVQRILAKYHTGTLLDVGTGRGETLAIARGLGFVCKGTETVDFLCNEDVVKALLPTLPFDDKSFETVTCFEVAEHLLPTDVLPALRELARVAKDRVILSVCIASDMRGGVELHPSYRSEFEWEQTFKAAWGADANFRKIGNVSSLDLSPVYEYCLHTAS